MDFEKIKYNIQKKVQDTKRSLLEREEFSPQILADITDKLEKHYLKLITVEKVDVSGSIQEIQDKYEELIFDRIKTFNFKTKECEQFLDALEYFVEYTKEMEGLETFPIDASFFDDLNYDKLYLISVDAEFENNDLLKRIKYIHHLWKKEAIALETAIHNLNIKNKVFLSETWNNLNKPSTQSGYMRDLASLELLDLDEDEPTMGLIDFENKLKRKVKDAQVNLIENRKDLEVFALNNTISEITLYEKEGSALDKKWNVLEEKIKNLGAETEVISYKLNFRENQKQVLMNHMTADLHKMDKLAIKEGMKEKLLKELEGFIKRDGIIDTRVQTDKLSKEEEEMLEDKYKIYKRMNKLGEYNESLHKTIYSDMAPRMTTSQQLLDKLVKRKKDLENKLEELAYPQPQRGSFEQTKQEMANALSGSKDL